MTKFEDVFRFYAMAFTN